MGVYIKGIDIPKENELIYLCINNKGIVECVKSIAGSRDGEEPTTLIEMKQAKATYILEPHGRLIDESVAYDKIAEQETSYYMDMDGVDRGLQDTPTVVEAEDDE